MAEQFGVDEVAIHSQKVGHPPSTGPLCRVCGGLLYGGLLEDAPGGVLCVFCGAPQPNPNGEPTAAGIPNDVGDALRSARETRGESLEHAAAETCIRERYLRGLEENELIEFFPGSAYARFFLRDYAAYLGLDPGPLMASFDDAGGGELPEPIDARWLPEPRRRNHAGIAMTLIAVIVLVVAVAVSRSRTTTPSLGAVRIPTPSTGPSIAAAPSASLPASPHSPMTHAQDPGVSAVLRFTARCWVQAYADGRLVVSHTFEAGDIRRLDARRSLTMTLGWPAGVDLTVAGDRVALQTGSVQHLSFAWRHGKIVGSTT
jgi:cytoskeleton protein RodZ